jgi:hypothetical protein
MYGGLGWVAKKPDLIFKINTFLFLQA